MIGLTCTKKKPMPESRATTLHPPPHLFIVFHPSVQTTQTKMQRADGTPVMKIDHYCPYCKERWGAQIILRPQ